MVSSKNRTVSSYPSCGLRKRFRQILSDVNVQKPNLAIYKRVASAFGERLLGQAVPMAMDYETWKPRRSLYNPFFTKNFLNTFIPVINECTEGLLEKLRVTADGKTEVSIKREYVSTVLLVVGKVIYGTDFTLANTLLPRKLLGRATDSPYESLIRYVQEGMQMSINNTLKSFSMLHPFKTMRMYLMIS